MNTYLECIPCFFKQAVESSKTLGADDITRKQIVDELANIVPSFPLESSPPEMGRIVHDIIRKKLKTADPYKELKKKSNELALGIYDRLKQNIKNSESPLLTGLQFSIAGNLIDYGANHNVKPEKEIADILNNKKRTLKRENFRYDVFKEKLESSHTVLFIGDNAGEIVFDRLLIEEINYLYPGKNMVYAVREKPVINDVTVEDAAFVGMDRTAKVVSSGSDVPGTILSRCNEKFIDIFGSSDMIISKGQGNFETLSDETAPLFFLLTVKCPVVAEKSGSNVGDIILKSSHLR